MIEFFVVYDEATGAQRWRGQGAPGTAAEQVLPAGLAAIVVPIGAIVGADVDLTVVRPWVCMRIDAAAEEVRKRFITDGAGQALTYQYKAAEAARVVAGDTGPTPFLTAEAAARGITVAALAAEVIAQVNAWIAVGARIEAVRMGAKAAVATGTTLGAIAAAGEIDWDAAIEAELAA